MKDIHPLKSTANCKRVKCIYWVEKGQNKLSFTQHATNVISSSMTSREYKRKRKLPILSHFLIAFSLQL